MVAPKVLGQVLVGLQVLNVQGCKDGVGEALEQVLAGILVLQSVNVPDGSDAGAVGVVQDLTDGLLVLVLVVVEGKLAAGMVTADRHGRAQVAEETEAALGDGFHAIDAEIGAGVGQDVLVKLLDGRLAGKQ